MTDDDDQTLSSRPVQKESDARLEQARRIVWNLCEQYSVQLEAPTPHMFVLTRNHGGKTLWSIVVKHEIECALLEMTRRTVLVLCAIVDI